MNFKLTSCLLVLVLLLLPQLQVNAKERQFNPVLVDLINSQGQKIGKAEFTQANNIVKIHVEASQLTPGVHGIHIHENGKCDPPDFSSAGAHFNPVGNEHGFNNPKGFHNGDLPNLEVGNDGKVVADFDTQAVTLEPGQPHSLLKEGGTSLVIHEKADDYKTDPSGNSGGKVACGVIQ